MNVSANMEAIRRLGREMQSESSAYNSETKKIYAAVDSLRNSWQGADNQSYIQKVNEQKQVIEDLGKVIENYATFLSDTANNLERIQNEIKAQAGRL